MTATVLPFARNSAEAWDLYHALLQEAKHNPALMEDRDHFERRTAAHETFARLYRRECARTLDQTARLG